jgi:diguanylate cyclase (GGDEF)-like protein
LTNTTRRDNETDLRLKLLVGLVVVAAAAAAIYSVMAIARSDLSTVDPVQLVTLVVLTTLGITVVVRVRIRAADRIMGWTEAAIVLGVAVAPVPWVVLCAGLGVALAPRVLKMPPLKKAFAISKVMLVAVIAGSTLSLLHWEWRAPLTPAMIASLAGAYLVAFLVDDLMARPVIAIDTKTKISTLLAEDLGLRVAAAVARFGIVTCALFVLARDPKLLVAVPPLVLVLHYAYSNRVRARLERQDWQRLASTTDAFNVVDLNKVLNSAVTSAAELFSTDNIEILVNHSPKRLVRGSEEGISFDGSPDNAPDQYGHAIVTPLSHDGNADVGELRLRFRGKVSLSAAEEYKLQTFASALSTAIQNAEAYAELGRLAAEHAHDATHDALTGLANRRQLMDRGNQVLASQRTDGVTALLLIDLNHFKEVNDTLGHGAGDRVLIQIGERLKRAAHNGDLVARLGGDEFAILLTSLSAPAVATHRAEGLLRALHEPMDVDGMRISVEASGGIAAAPSTGGMPEILRRADVAMYQAKRSGRRVATYSKTRDTADVGRLTLGGDLSRAMAEHEFTVNFQPIVDLGTGQVVAAEALARWHHPEQGTIDPLRFLETVERSELLPAFAEAVLDQSLIAAGAWREAGFDLPVAVNVSPRSLLDARFPGAVMARLRAHDLPPDKLILELTETLTISQLEVVDRVLGRLRDEGVRLALDDFGTGYSSLSVLSRIPVNQLKIDREFVTSMETSPEATAVIRSTVDLARSLDLAVVAEGVESEPQRLALWEMGCAAGQGHLFARPMAAPRLLAALHRGSGGRPGTLAPPLHEEGSVIRFSPRGRPEARSRTGRLPHSHP